MKKLFKLENSPFYPETLNGKLKAKLEQVDYNAKQDTYISRQVIYKSDEYVKLILPKDINLTQYHKLSKLATTLLYYIITIKLEYNSPTFTLKIGEFCALLEITSTAKGHRAVRELIDFSYIARTKTKEVYWINHNRYYKGKYITINQVVQHDTDKRKRN